MKSKELKSEKIKKEKEEEGKGSAMARRIEGGRRQRERTERRKRRRMQNPSPQRRQRERERESHLCKSVRKIFSILQDCCNCVAVWERQSFRLFNFFCRVQVSLCIGMKIKIFFFHFYLLR